MKKLLLPLAGLLTLGLVAGCSDDATTTVETETETLNIVTTVYPLYDWTSEILGDEAENVNLTYLLNSGVDVHSYQASSADIITIAEADMVIYVGGESDIWVEDILATSSKEGQIVLNLVDILGDDVKIEEYVEGMEVTEHSHDHDHDEEEGEVDEHIWLSLDNASDLCEAIASSLAQLDSNNAALYQANVEAYIAQLDALDEQFETMVANSTYDTILVADRFPFRYLVDDYNLNYYAAFVGCSAETEASFETMAFLTQKVDELNLHTVLTIENSDCRIADTVVASSTTKDQEILVLNSLQSVSQTQIDAGITYLGTMEENLEVLTQALK